eukprot:359365-Chlamydomonas_euryale.AAC.3
MSLQIRRKPTKVVGFYQRTRLCALHAAAAAAEAAAAGAWPQPLRGGGRHGPKAAAARQHAGLAGGCQMKKLRAPASRGRERVLSTRQRCSPPLLAQSCSGACIVLMLRQPHPLAATRKVQLRAPRTAPARPDLCPLQLRCGIKMSSEQAFPSTR